MAPCHVRAMSGHLLHVGYPKTGSNYLRSWFAAHPELAYLPAAIAGYRDVYQIARDATNEVPEARYRVTSAEHLSLPHRFAGFPSADIHGPAGRRGSSELACERLSVLFPAAHILIVTRGFRSMAQSARSQFVRTGGDPNHPFRSQEEDYGPWDYDALIAMYEQRFLGRVKVLPWELLRDDLPRFLGEIEAWLGLGHCEPPAGRPNPSLTETELRWYARFTRRLRRIRLSRSLRRRLLRAYFPLSRQNRLAGLIRILDLLGLEAPPVAEVDEEMIERHRGKAESLRGNPLYAPYAADYFH